MIRGTSRRLTFDPADDFGPVWSPDGAGSRSPPTGRASGISTESGPTAWATTSAAGLQGQPQARGGLVAGRQVPGLQLLAGRTAMDLFLLPLLPGGPASPSHSGHGDSPEQRAQFAPGGRFIAYNSTESGRDEVYVQSVPPDGGRGPGTWQISTDGGWSPGGGMTARSSSTSPARTIVAVEVNPLGRSFEAGAPKPLFEVRLAPEARSEPLRGDPGRAAVPGQHTGGRGGASPSACW